MNLIGKSVSVRDLRIKILDFVGRWGHGFQYPVYTASVSARIPPQTGLVTIMVAPNNQDFWEGTTNKEEFADCFSRIYRAPKILLSTYMFHTRFENLETQCICLPYMKSVRSLFNHSDGLAINLVAFVVKEGLMALSDIHDFGYYHGNISAASLFYHPKKGLKLCFGPYFYVSLINNEYGLGFMNVYKDIHEKLGTGGEPPVDVDEDELPPVYVDEDELSLVRFCKKNDIWSIGVLALELAYGNIMVKNRDEFLSVIDYIKDKEVLPNRWSHLKFLATKYHEMSKDSKKNKFRHRVISHPRMTADFVHFLHCCFATTLADRPNVTTLLQHDFVTRQVASLEAFQQATAPFFD